MICFPNAKINLGLRITEKRTDGFHNIETVFYPIGWNDALEVVESPNSSRDFTLHLSGLPIDGAIENNLLFKAFSLIKEIKSLPEITVYLYKNIPMGAGLGGGSSDCAFFINLLDTQFNLNITEAERTNIARKLGSDCAFFIKNKPVFAQGKGDKFKQLDIDFSEYYIAVIYPGIHCDTKTAYSLLSPQKQNVALTEVIKKHPLQWKNILLNDFEPSVFKNYPLIGHIKDELCAAGAFYASLSGSGSSVFGLFEKLPQIGKLTSHMHYISKML